MAYTVKSGDTLGQIAAALGVADWRTLYVGDVLAGETDPRRLAVGATIYTPDEGAGGTPGPAAEDGSDSPAGQENPIKQGPNVQVTDTTQTGPDNLMAGVGISAQTGADTAAIEQQAQQGVGGLGQDPETALTILTGREMIWSLDPKTGKWYVSYKLPNSSKRALFEADPDQMDALFGKGMRPGAYQEPPGGLQELLGLQGNIFSGNIGEMEGSGSFEAEVAKATALALDDNPLPAWAEGSDAAMDLVYLANAEGKSQDWLLDQLSELPEFNKRFPGLTKFASGNNLSLPDAVTGFLEFEAGAKAALDAAGFEGDVLHPTMVTALMDKGYSLTVVAETVNTFKRMVDFAPAMDAFNQILVAAGADPITDQNDFFQFLNGQAPAETYDLYEASSLQEAAAQFGVSDFGAQDAINVALAGNHNAQTANQGMQQAASLLLRFRNEVDVGKFDLDHEELIDISLGMAPRSGRTDAEINESIQRAVATAQGQLQSRAKPFTGFTQTGTPQAASLSNLRQTS